MQPSSRRSFDSQRQPQSHPQLPGAGAGPTLEQVARSCGLTKSTISKALNLAPENCPLTEATRLRAIEAARRLGYRPRRSSRPVAHSASRNAVRTIALIHHSLLPSSNDSWKAMLRALVGTLYAGGCAFQFLPTGPDSARLLSDHRFTGGIILHELSDSIAHAAAQAHLPLVLLNAWAAGATDDAYSAVLPDDLTAGRTLGEHLLSRGHRCLAFIDNHEQPMRHFSFHQRIAGLQKALADHRCPPLRILCGRAPDQVARLSQLNPRPTAVVAYDDRVSLPLLHACWEQGIVVPRDLAVATFNDSLMTRHAIPPLTTMRLPVEAMGCAAGELLLQLLERSDTSDVSSRRIVLPAELVVRDSTAVPQPQEMIS